MVDAQASYPGYVLVKMVMNDDTWYVVRNTRGCTGFVGPRIQAGAPDRRRSGKDGRGSQSAPDGGFRRGGQRADHVRPSGRLYGRCRGDQHRDLQSEAQGQHVRPGDPPQRWISPRSSGCNKPRKQTNHHQGKTACGSYRARRTKACSWEVRRQRAATHHRFFGGAFYHGTESNWLHQAAKSRPARQPRLLPVGPALGQKGVNIMAFTKEFNDERTKNQMGYIIPRRHHPCMLTVPLALSPRLPRLLF